MRKVKNRRNHGWLVAIVMVVILIGICSMAYAKYIQQDKFEETLIITADIGTIDLLEHQAVRQSDGSYKLNDVLLPIINDPATTEDEEEVLGNVYELLPGLDIPKDPFVRIVKEDKIPVYVYLKINDSIENEFIQYSITDQWKFLLNDDGDAVYVYTNGTEDAVAVTESIDEIQILVDNKVIVNQNVRFGTKIKDLELTFYAYMYQTASGTDGLSVYENN